MIFDEGRLDSFVPPRMGGYFPLLWMIVYFILRAEPGLQQLHGTNVSWVMTIECALCLKSGFSKAFYMEHAAPCSPCIHTASYSQQGQYVYLIDNSVMTTVI